MKTPATIPARQAVQSDDIRHDVQVIVPGKKAPRRVLQFFPAITSTTVGCYLEAYAKKLNPNLAGNPAYCLGVAESIIANLLTQPGSAAELRKKIAAFQAQ